MGIIFLDPRNWQMNLQQNPEFLILEFTTRTIHEYFAWLIFFFYKVHVENDPLYSLNSAIPFHSLNSVLNSAIHNVLYNVNKFKTQ